MEHERDAVVIIGAANIIINEIFKRHNTFTR